MWIPLLALCALPQDAAADKSHVRAQTALQPSSVAAGDSATVRYTLWIDKGWHIYPHDFDGIGNKSVLEAKFPAGFALGDVKWPAAKTIDLFGTPTRVHEDEVTIEGRVSVDPSVKPGSYELAADLTFQACSNVCVDGAKVLKATLAVTAAEPGKVASAPAGSGAPAGGGASAGQGSETPGKGIPVVGTIVAGPENYRMTPSFEISTHGLAPGEEAILTIAISVDPGWHTYSPKSDPGGQVPLRLKAEGLELVGELEGPEPKKHYDELLKITLLEYSGDFTLKQRVRAPKAGISGTQTVTLDGQTCDVNSCLQPTRWKAEFTLRAYPPGSAVVAPANGGDKPKKVEKGAASADESTVAGSRSMSFGRFLLFSAGGGAASLFTPCVFPMIPITVSFFSKRAHGKRGRAVGLATTYALGILGTFTLIGVLFSAILGAASLTNFATNIWVNLTMGTLFVVLGLSLLGLFNITAPAALTNKIEEARGATKNDLVMTFLMAIAFTLASFTCTVPVLGVLLGLAAEGGSTGRAVAGMLAYSATFAAPFFLLALFPTSLRNLPKGGVWLEVMKVSMGLVEFAAALKFLSNADIGADTQLLTRPVFLAIWIALFLALALYLFGVLRLPGAEGEVGPIRASFGIASLALSLYLLAGLFGLRYGQFLESFLPPDGYGGQTLISARGEKAPALTWYQDLDEARAVAKKENRRLFLNFTGDQCVNCRGMEQGFFPRPYVMKELERFVRVELWLDRTSTPELAERSARYVDYELKKFDTPARPYYAILEPDGETVVATYPGAIIPGTKQEAEYLAFLRGA